MVHIRVVQMQTTMMISQHSDGSCIMVRVVQTQQPSTMMMLMMVLVLIMVVQILQLINYDDSGANTDDGSCVISGCTDD